MCTMLTSSCAAVMNGKMYRPSSAMTCIFLTLVAHTSTGTRTVVFVVEGWSVSIWEIIFRYLDHIALEFRSHVLFWTVVVIFKSIAMLLPSYLSKKMDGDETASFRCSAIIIDRSIIVYNNSYTTK